MSKKIERILRERLETRKQMDEAAHIELIEKFIMQTACLHEGSAASANREVVLKRLRDKLKDNRLMTFAEAMRVLASVLS